MAQWVDKKTWIQNHPNNRAKMNDLAMKIQELISPYCTRTTIAGSLRRQKPICSDVDLVTLISASDGVKLLNTLNKSGLQVKGFGDIAEDKIFNIDFVVPENHPFNLTGKEQKGQIFSATNEKNFYPLFLHRTGSMDFNVYMSYTARLKSMKLSMYGLFDRKTDEFLAGSEEEIFQKLHMMFVFPKNRNLQWLKVMGWWHSEHRYSDLKQIGVIKPKSTVTKE